MKLSSILTRVSCVAVLALLSGGVVLADAHHDGHAKIRGTNNGNVHVLTTRNGHSAHAAVQNGKMSGLSVHRGGKNVSNTVSIKKFKTKNKKHLNDGVVVIDEGTDANQVVTWVGFGFYCPFDNQWYVFWFPVQAVNGGDAGSEEI